MHQERTVIADSIPFGLFPDVSTEYPLERMANTGLADKVTFRVTGTFDQEVNITVVGGDSPDSRDLSSLVSIGAAVPLPIGSTTTQVLGRTVNLVEDWWPWVGLMVTTGLTAPTAGRITALAIVRHLAHEDDEDTQLLSQIIAKQDQILQQLGGPVAGRPGSIWPFGEGS